MKPRTKKKEKHCLKKKPISGQIDERLRFWKIFDSQM